MTDEDKPKRFRTIGELMTDLMEEEDQFWGLVIEAYQTGQAFDGFDLHSESDESKARFKELWEVQQEVALRLVRYVVEHQDELISKFQEPYGDD